MRKKKGIAGGRGPWLYPESRPEELALVPCPCRTRTEKMGIRECKDKFPVGSCIMMGPTALHFEAIALENREQL